MGADKKIFKLAVIRSNGQDPCPFGLPIPFGCKNAGDFVLRMANINGNNLSDDEVTSIANANRQLLMWAISEGQGGKCSYADKLFDNKNAVQCNWQEENATGALRGSPFYYKHFSGIGLDGMYSMPLEHYYSDYNIDFGLYSLESVQAYNLKKTFVRKK